MCTLAIKQLINFTVPICVATLTWLFFIIMHWCLFRHLTGGSWFHLRRLKILKKQQHWYTNHLAGGRRRPPIGPNIRRRATNLLLTLLREEREPNSNSRTLTAAGNYSYYNEEKLTWLHQGLPGDVFWTVEPSRDAEGVMEYLMLQAVMWEIKSDLFVLTRKTQCRGRC